MALEGLLQIRERVIATADLSTHQYKFVTLGGALCGDGALGFPLVDKPANGGVGTLVLVGKAKITCGGTVAAGADVASNASGLAVDATSGEEVLGIMLEAGVANDVAMMLVNPMGIL